MPSLLDKVKNKLGLKKKPPGHKLGGGDYSCQQQQQQQVSQSKPKLRRELSDQEKEARRDAMAAAAANREQAWDKKVNKGAQFRRQEEKKKKQEQEQNSSVNDSKERDDSFLVQSEETRRMVEEAKRSEQQLAESMGYNPYEPVMSSSANSKGGGGAGASSSSSSSSAGSSQAFTANHASGRGGGGEDMSSSGFGRDDFADIDGDVKLQFAAAVECLLHQALSGVADESMCGRVFTAFPDADDAAVFEQGKVCISTVVKMLTNLSANPNDPKFRSIRLNNKHFSGKVAEVEGGLELIMSAGFVLEEVLEEGEEEGVSGTFLKHHGGPMAERQLDFTLSRLRHIQTCY